MKRGLPGGTLAVPTEGAPKGGPGHVVRRFGPVEEEAGRAPLEETGATKEVIAVSPDADALRSLAARTARHGEPVRAAIESMNAARFVHDTLELCGWDVEIADAQKVKGLAPLACKTDRIDAWVLAELARRDLVPAIWLPTPGVRAERELARFRLHLGRDPARLPRAHRGPR